MNNETRNTSPSQQLVYPAEKARGGEIILRKPWQRAIFIAGLAIPIILLILLAIWRVFA
jgi:hypothetical protein